MIGGVQYICKSRNCKRWAICGDSFEFNYIDTNGSFRAVLCDGMGHGIKANILANVTKAFIKRIDFNNFSLEDIAQKLEAVQPVCSIRETAYATYTLVDYCAVKRKVRMVNYDNPKPMLFVDGEMCGLDWQEFVVDNKGNKPNKIYISEFDVQPNSTITMCSDGVTQSGTGRDFAFGWGIRAMGKFIENLLRDGVSLDQLAVKVVVQSLEYEYDYSHDDITFAVINIK